MKFLPLIWAGVWRKPVRTVLTVLSLVAAFTLFGMLRSVDTGFDNLLKSFRGDRIFVGPRFFSMPLPLSYVDQIAHLEGVTNVGYQVFVGGYYRDPKTFAFVGGASPNMLELYGEIEVSTDALSALRGKPNGVLISPWMAEHLGRMKIGDHYTVHSNDLRQKDGSQDWDFEVVGFLDRKDAPGVFSFAFGNFDYINEARAEPRNVVQQIAVRVADESKAFEMAHAIDAMFLNSGTPIRASVDRNNFESGVASLGNVKLIVNGTIASALLVLLLVTTTTMAQSVDERISELAVLKTLGFRDEAVFGLIAVESLLQCLVGAAGGLAAAAFITPRMQGKLPGPPVFFHVPAVVFISGFIAAVVIAVAAAAVPGWRARRLQIVDALAKR